MNATGWGRGDFRTVCHKEITYLSAKYFAKCSNKLFRNMNAIEGLVTIQSRIQCIVF